MLLAGLVWLVLLLTVIITNVSARAGIVGELHELALFMASCRIIFGYDQIPAFITIRLPDV